MPITLSERHYASAGFLLFWFFFKKILSGNLISHRDIDVGQSFDGHGKKSPLKTMQKLAASAGFASCPLWSQRFPRLCRGQFTLI